MIVHSPYTRRDANGPYTPGTYRGDAVHVYGERHGFTYFAYASNLSWVTKVPTSWMGAQA